ncbi:MAG: FecR family protein [Cyanobacteria bacterium J06659_2]
MLRYSLIYITGICWALASVLLPGVAKAQALTRARVEGIRNRVELIPQGRNARRAQVSDVMGVGDALRTAASSQAELRFNDGSLARVGERATFRFVPNTRNFRLSNGTVLLLVPPGRGRTNIQTPNAVTGIQGSGVFCRYDAATDTTIVGALTDSALGPMVVSNRDGSEMLPLNGGEMAVIQNDRIVGHYRFSLDDFSRTNTIARGLDLFNPPADEQPNADGLDGVRSEVADASSNQSSFEGPDVTLSTGFMGLSEPSNSVEIGEIEFAVIPEDPFAGLPPTGSLGQEPASGVTALPGGSQVGDSPTLPPGLLGSDGPSTGGGADQPTMPVGHPPRPVVPPGPIDNPVDTPNISPSNPVTSPPVPLSDPVTSPGQVDNPGNRPVVPPGQIDNPVEP